MSTSFGLSEAVRVFPCPNCRETINTSMVQCPFCSAAINHDAAEAAAADTSIISQACSDASYLKIMAGVAGGFLVARFVLFFGMLGILGFAFMEIALPVMAARWWWKYRSIKTDDPDFPAAKKVAIAVTAGCALFFLLRLVGVISIKPF